MLIAICDNSTQSLNHLSGLLNDYIKVRPTLPPLHIHPFTSCQALWAAVEAGQQFDLCLLDAMPQYGMDGIALAERFSAQAHRPNIVFFSQTADLAVEAFRVRAKHYLLKPLGAEKLFSALDEVISPMLMVRDTPVVLSTVQNRRTTVPLSSILYTECSVHTIRYHLEDGVTLDSRSIRVPFATAIADLLSSGRFIQPHRSFAANMEHIARLTGQELILRNGVRIPISRLRLADCRAAYQHFLLTNISTV